MNERGADPSPHAAPERRRTQRRRGAAPRRADRRRVPREQCERPPLAPLRARNVEASTEGRPRGQQARRAGPPSKPPQRPPGRPVLEQARDRARAAEAVHVPPRGPQSGHVPPPDRRLEGLRQRAQSSGLVPVARFFKPGRRGSFEYSRLAVVQLLPRAGRPRHLLVEVVVEEGADGRGPARVGRRRHLGAPPRRRPRRPRPDDAHEEAVAAGSKVREFVVQVPVPKPVPPEPPAVDGLDAAAPEGLLDQRSEHFGVGPPQDAPR